MGVELSKELSAGCGLERSGTKSTHTQWCVSGKFETVPGNKLKNQERTNRLESTYQPPKCTSVVCTININKGAHPRGDILLCERNKRGSGCGARRRKGAAVHSAAL